MNYIELNISVPSAEIAEILTAELSELPFDSFTTEKGMLKAYIPQDALVDCKADADAESAAAKFLDGIGVVFLVWPHSQNKPDGATNRAVLNESNIRIVKVEKINHEL